jgi:hypothetical protein
MSAESVARRQWALDGIVERVRKHAGSWLRASETVQISIACGMRAPDELLGVLINDKSARNALAHKQALAITDDEWTALYGADAIEVRGKPLTELLQQKTFQRAVGAIESALRTTIAEQIQGATWTRQIAQAAVYVGFHAISEEKLIAASLGSIVRADSRRMRDIIDQVDDDGPDTMLLARAIVALASVTT